MFHVHRGKPLCYGIKPHRGFDALQVSSEDAYERELTSSTSNATRPSERKRSRRSLLSQFGNLKLIKDNYPKYVVTMDPNVGLIHDSGIVACSARQFLLNFVS